MIRFHKIKAAQIIAAQSEERPNPYSIAVQPPISVPVSVIDDDRPNRLKMIKAQQMKEAEKTGINPYQPREAVSATAADVHGDLAHYQAAMSADLASLSVLKDVVEKAKAKAAMLATYWPFVKAYMDNGDNYPNDIAVRVCIWLFDTLNIERGIDLALVLIKQNQVTPPKFDRDLPTFVCDAVYDWANACLKMDPPQSASPYLDALVATIDNEKWSLSPPVQSKMYAMLAKHKNRVGEYATAVALCDKAEAVNPEGHGTKGLKNDAQAKLKETPKDE